MRSNGFEAMAPKRSGRLDALLELLLGQGGASRKVFLVTLSCVCAAGGPLTFLAIYLAVSLLGRGPGPDQQILLDLSMFGISAGLSLLLWILLGQALRRIRSIGQSWMILFLFLAVPFPILILPLSLGLSVLPDLSGHPVFFEPKSWHRLAIAPFGLLVATAAIGLPCAIFLAFSLQA